MKRKKTTVPFLTRLAEQTSTHPFFLGCHLALLRQEYQQTPAEQAVALGLDLEAWSKLALHRMPATRQDLERIARAFEMEPGRLAELLQLDLEG
jgi:hypothetical protein